VQLENPDSMHISRMPCESTRRKLS